MTNPKLTPEKLAELKRLDADASEAPWCWQATGEKSNEWVLGQGCNENGRRHTGQIFDSDDLVDPVMHGEGSGNLVDPALIVALRNLAPALLAAARERDRLRGLMDQHPGMCCGACAQAIEAAERNLRICQAALRGAKEEAERDARVLRGALRDIIYASDRCLGHRGCSHSMEPWKRARAFIAEAHAAEEGE